MDHLDVDRRAEVLFCPQTVIQKTGCRTCDNYVDPWYFIGNGTENQISALAVERVRKVDLCYNVSARHCFSVAPSCMH